MFLLQSIPLRKHASHQSHSAQSTHDDPNRLQRIRISLDQLGFLDPGFHGLDDAAGGGGVLAVGSGHGWEMGVGEEFLFDLVLEDDAADGYVEGLAEDADE